MLIFVDKNNQLQLSVTFNLKMKSTTATYIRFILKTETTNRNSLHPIQWKTFRVVCNALRYNFQFTQHFVQAHRRKVIQSLRMSDKLRFFSCI